MNEILKNIRLLILDVDGVMTDGRIIFDSNGIESKFFNVKDGHGIKMLQRSGIEVAIISGRESQVVTNRAAELGIRHVYQKSLKKMDAYLDLQELTGFTDAQTAFIGDDIIDIPVLRRVGFAAAPADALVEVLPYVLYVCKSRGGGGAVREVGDMILKAADLWESATARYFID